MSITFNTNFSNRLDDAAIDPIVLVEVGSTTSWYFSTRALLSGAGTGYDNYEAVLTFGGDLDERLPAEIFSIAERGQWSFGVENASKRELDIGDLPEDSLDGRTVVVKIGFLTDGAGSAFALSDFVTVFTGVVRDYKADEGTLMIYVEDSSLAYHRALPLETVPDGDAHQDVVGDPLPITFGVLDRAVGLLTDMTLGAQVYKFDRVALYDFDYLYLWDDDYKNYIRVSDQDEEFGANTEYVFSEASALVTFNGATNPYAERGEIILLTDVHFVANLWNYNSAAMTNPEGLMTGVTGATQWTTNTSTVYSGIMWFATCSGTYESNRIATYKPRLTHKLGTIRRVHLFIQIWFDDYTYGNCCATIAQIAPEDGFPGGGGGNNAGEVHIITGDFDNTLGGADYGTLLECKQMVIGDNASPSLTDKKVRWGTAGWETLDRSRFVLMTYWIDNSSTANIFTLYCGWAYLTVASGASFDNHPRIYAKVDGRRRNSTWDSRFTSGSLITNPIYFMEMLFRNDLGLNGSQIDYDSFDDAAAIAPTMTATAGQVLEEMDSRDIMRELCYLCRAMLTQRVDGDVALTKIDYSSPTLVRTFDSDMILKQKKGKTTLKWERSPWNLVYNEIYIYYDYNPATDDYDSLLYVTADDNNFANTTNGAAAETACDTSQTKYNYTNRLTIESKWIRGTDAETLAWHLINTEKIHLRHYVASFLTPWKHSLDLEIGDLITIDYEWLPVEVRHAGTGSQHYWNVTGHTNLLDTQQMRIYAWSLDGV